MTPLFFYVDKQMYYIYNGLCKQAYVTPAVPLQVSTKDLGVLGGTEPAYIPDNKVKTQPVE